MTSLVTPMVTNSVNPISEEIADDDEMWPEDAVLLNAAKQVEQVTSFFEEEDEEQERLLLAALLGAENAESAPAVSQQDKKPKGKEAKKTPVAVCKKCGTALMTLDGFIRHKMTHAMSGELLSCLLTKS